MSAYASPVFSIAGAMPGEPEMSHWKTAYVNPDAAVTGDLGRRRPHNGPSLSIAGAMPGGPTATWHTAYPTGESIYVAELRNAEARALARGEAKVLPFTVPTGRVRPQAKAA